MSAHQGVLSDAKSSQEHSTDHHEKSEAGVQGDHAAVDDSAMYMSREELKSIMRKLDWAIIPYCSLLYLLSFLDRVNIGQAAVAGLKQDLNIVNGNLYDVSLSLFFVGYVIVEVPSECA